MSIQVSIKNGEYRIKILKNGLLKVFMTAESMAQVVEKLKGICNV